MALAFALAASGCALLAPLARAVQAPEFRLAPGYSPQLAVLPPAPNLPAGGVQVRIWTEVHNPNGFSITLTELRTTLFLDEDRVTRADFPLGLPLRARQQTIVPIEVLVSSLEAPGLVRAVRRAARGEDVEYRLDGTVGVDAGPFGQPVFGPMTLLRGEVRSTVTGWIGALEAAESAGRDPLTDPLSERP